jgi:DNA processing protein
MCWRPLSSSRLLPATAMVAGFPVLERSTMTSSVSGSRVAQVRGATLTGVTVTLIDVRATIDPGKRGFEIPGVPGCDTWTLRDRVRAAVLNSAMAWPQAGITLELSPGVRFRRGCGLDLAIAVAILTADGIVPSPAGPAPVFAAELGLDGALRPVRGIVPVLTAVAGGPVAAVVALGNQPDIAAAPGVTAAACADLRQVAAWMRGELDPGARPGTLAAGPPGPPGPGRSAGQRLSAPNDGPDGRDLMSITDTDRERIARAVLTYLAEPGDPLVTALLAQLSAAEVVGCIRSGTLPGGVTDAVGATAAESALQRCRRRLGRVPPGAGLAGPPENGIRLLCPGDPDWPAKLDDLGPARPYALWARGGRGTDLRACWQRSVSVVGSRAATAYGTHMATQIAGGLAGQGWTVVSGGAYGIDAAAHTGALAAKGMTVAVLACGPDQVYPRGHQELFSAIADSGVIVSEYPPGQRPSRHRFVARNRLIAALSAGTVVVEAAVHSGTMGTARHARQLERPVMAMPGPVTSAQAGGCHQLIRDGVATCVTSAGEVIGCVTTTRGYR